MRRRTPALVVAALAAAVLLPRPAQAADGPGAQLAPLVTAAGADVLPDRYIVVLNAAPGKGQQAAGEASAVARARGHGVRIDRLYDHALSGFAAALTADQLAAVRADPDVAYVEHDRIARLDSRQRPVPSWGLDRVDQRNRALDNTYNYFPTGAGVRAYIVDTGIRLSHRDFGGRATVGADVVGDGRNGNDCFGHGTQVAGVLGGQDFGVAKGVQLVAVRAGDCAGSATTSRLIAGINWVVTNAVRPAVVNLSFGVGADPAMDRAVGALVARDIPVFTSAGNASTDACRQSPARVPEAITVGASDIFDSPAWFSNSGSCVDLYAPGDGVVSDGIASDTDFGAASGTSMAAPYVAGTAALLLQTHRSIGWASVRHAITSTATAGALSPLPAGSPNLLLFTPAADRAFGNVDLVYRTPTTMQVFGWAADPDALTAPIDVHIYVDDVFVTAATANRSRPDVATAFPGFGANHGFDVPIVPSPGEHTLCVYAIDAEIGPDNPQLTCLPFAMASDPFGGLDAMTPVADGVWLDGWTIDYDTFGPVQVQVLVDGAIFADFPASQPRPGLGAAFPGYGDNHAFRGTFFVPSGQHTVCVIALNVGPGPNKQLRCQSLLIP